MIKLKSVSKTYNKGKTNAVTALQDVSIEIEEGELVAIVGKSGAGKSTLLHILACIDSYEEGEYMIDDILIKDLSEKKLANIRNKHVGIVMQDYALIDDFTAVENVMLPLDFAKNGKKGKSSKKDRKAMVMTALDLVEMAGFADKEVSKLSGGQKQRVAIARAVVNDPGVILADEPTGALDSGNADAIMKLFESLHEQGKTVIIVTHDRELAERCERIIELSDGRIVKNRTGNYPAEI